MQTRTKSQPASRTGRRSTPAPQGRFGRPGLPARRKPPQQSTAQKALSALTGALGGSTAKGKGKSKSKSKAKAGGSKSSKGRMALLAGGLGLAMKNRDKIQGLMGRRAANKSAASAAAPAPQPPPPGA
jgi:hypothetical protein